MKKTEKQKSFEYDNGVHRRYTSKSEVNKAFNNLYGIVKGIALDSKINEKELQELDLWLDDHQYLMTKNPFNDIITNIQVILSDNDVTGDEIEDMLWLCEQYKDGFTYFDEDTVDIHILHGLCHGILADGIINEAEIIGLNKWLDLHSHLESFFPYDEILSLITTILSDGKIDEDEKNTLKKYLTEFVTIKNVDTNKLMNEELKHIQVSGICAIDPVINFSEKLFVISGKSDRATRRDFINTIRSNGGVIQENVTLNTDYLIVGNKGNPCWSHSCYGRKIETAIKYRKRGQRIVIVNENDFWDVLEE